MQCEVLDSVSWLSAISHVFMYRVQAIELGPHAQEDPARSVIRQPKEKSRATVASLPHSWASSQVLGNDVLPSVSSLGHLHTPEEARPPSHLLGGLAALGPSRQDNCGCISHKNYHADRRPTSLLLNHLLERQPLPKQLQTIQNDSSGKIKPW